MAQNKNVTTTKSSDSIAQNLCISSFQSSPSTTTIFQTTQNPTISSFSPSRTFSSPSPSPPPSTTRPSQPQTQTQSLFDMMSKDQNRDAKLSDEKRRKIQDRLKKLLEEVPFSSGDVKLTVVGKEGLKVLMEVQKSVLADKIRFFAEKLRCDGGDGNRNGMTHSVEISDCDDVDVYVEAIVLMHYVDLNKRLRFIIEDGVSEVLNLLKVSAAIMFDLGVMSCLEYLEAITMD